MTDSINPIRQSPFLAADQLFRELKTLGYGKTPSTSTTESLPGLLQGMGIDGLELSSEASRSLQYAKAQFEMNFQAIKSLNSANGSETRDLSFSFRASFEFLQRISGGTPVDQGTPAAGSGTAEPGSPASADSAAGTDLMARLEEFFSPEKTSQRILDFALHFFPLSRFQQEGDGEASRQGFADFIGKAIQTGFDQAFQILGTLPDEVKSVADETHDLVFQGLQDFVKNGIPTANSGAGERYERIEAYRVEMSFSAEVRSSRKAGGEAYDPKGQTGEDAGPSGGKIDIQS